MILKIYLILHNVPGLCDSLMSSDIVLLLSLVHVFSQGDINIISQDIGCNASSKLTDENDRKKNWELFKISNY